MFKSSIFAALFILTCSFSTAQAEPRPDKLQIIDTRMGSGATLEQGELAEVHYTGWLYDASAPEHKGQRFDSSHDRKEPFVFRIGTGDVIQGWDEGVGGMKTGGHRTLIVPSSMGYGPRGAGRVIPPDTDLVFEIELITIPLH